MDDASLSSFPPDDHSQHSSKDHTHPHVLLVDGNSVVGNRRGNFLDAVGDDAGGPPSGGGGVRGWKRPLGRVSHYWRQFSTARPIHMFPAMFLFTFAFALYHPSLMILMVERACEVVEDGGTHAQDEACNSASVTGYTSKWLLYAALINSVVPALAAGTWGTLSDRYGRRVALLVPAVCNLLQVLLILYFGVLHLSFWVVIAAGSISGIGGGSGTMFCGLFAFTADVTESRHRTLYFSILAAIQDVGVMLGNLSVGWIVTRFGFVAPFYAIAAVYGALALYACVLPESLSYENQQKKLKWRQVNSIGALSILWRRPPPHLGGWFRRSLGLLTITFALTYAAFIAWVMIVVLYAKQLFHWDANMISYFGATESGARSLAVLILAPLLFRVRTKLSPGLVVAVALVMQTISFVFYSTADSTALMFSGVLFEGLSAVAIPTMRAILSRAMPDDEQGKVLSVISVVETAVNVIAPIIVTAVFHATNHSCPRCTIYGVLGLSVASVVLGALYAWFPLHITDHHPPTTTTTTPVDGDEENGADANARAIKKAKGLHTIAKETSSLIIDGAACPYIDMNRERDHRDFGAARATFGSINSNV